MKGQSLVIPGSAVSATHCGAGCVLGDLIAEWVVFAAGLRLAGLACSYDRPAPAPGTNLIGSLTTAGDRRRPRPRPGNRPVEGHAALEVAISGSSGDFTVLLYRRSAIPGLTCGGKVRFRGKVGIRAGDSVMISPAYELRTPDQDM